MEFSKLNNLSQKALNKNSLDALRQENVNLDTEESRNDEESKCPSKFSDLYEGQCKGLSESAKTQEALKKDYGSEIAEHLMKMESRNNVTDFLSQHKVSADYRAKMVDWIVEVLTTFKCSDQSFFKTI
jgi:predicted nuclease with TOPRIM domain